MAHFRGTVKGGRGEASRLGTSKSGLTTTCDGWGLGVTVHAWVESDGEDMFSVTLDEGSGYNSGRTIELGVFTKAKFEKILKERDAEWKVDKAAGIA